MSPHSHVSAHDTPVADAAAAIEVRDATADDVAAIAAIYAHHVLHGTGTFEEVAPTEEEMRRRWRDIVDRGLPYLVAGERGSVGGFAYAAPFRPRSAYRHTVEDSIYVSPEAIGRGLGRLLLATVIERCEALGLRQMVAVVGDSANDQSIGLHRALGFVQVGVLTSVGFKFGQWVDVVHMQRPLGQGDRTLPQP